MSQTIQACLLTGHSVQHACGAGVQITANSPFVAWRLVIHKVMVHTGASSLVRSTTGRRGGQPGGAGRRRARRTMTLPAGCMKKQESGLALKSERELLSSCMSEHTSEHDPIHGPQLVTSCPNAHMSKCACMSEHTSDRA